MPEIRDPTQFNFDQYPPEFKFFAVDKNGEAWVYTNEPIISEAYGEWRNEKSNVKFVGGGFDATYWRGSLQRRSK